jgi:hypothetical protein
MELIQYLRGFLRLIPPFDAPHCVVLYRTKEPFVWRLLTLRRFAKAKDDSDSDS